MAKPLNERMRNMILAGLDACTDSERLVFNKMYSPNNFEAPVSTVVANMPDSKLHWAMMQVLRSVV